jgi:hypothetical protein
VAAARSLPVGVRGILLMNSHLTCLSSLFILFLSLS